MEENLSSFKSLEKVSLKATYNMQINNRTFEEGELVAYFDSVEISNFDQIRSSVTATGGFDNRGLVYWDTTKEIRFTFARGVFSNQQFGLLNNAHIIQIGDNESLKLTEVEYAESDEQGLITTKYTPVDQIFVYDRDTGEKISWSKVNNKLKINSNYHNVIVNYRYDYNGGANIAKIGQEFLRGFLELEGRTRVKDDSSGLITTGIIKIPKLKLMSGLSMRLGVQANPVVSTFYGVGVPVESRRNSYVAEIQFLNNDIDSNM